MIKITGLQSSLLSSHFAIQFLVDERGQQDETFPTPCALGIAVNSQFKR